MEDELIAQRDAAVAVTKELQRQLQNRCAEMERTFERRTLNAERLRLHAEEKLRRSLEDRDWSESCCRQLLVLTLFFGCGGAVAGWSTGLLVLVVAGEPFVGFLMVLPAMALGMLMGMAVAKTKIHLETNRRYTRNKDTCRHFEVETAINSGLGEKEVPLAPLGSVLGMEDVASENFRSWEQDSHGTEAKEIDVAAGPTSFLHFGWRAAWFTLHATKDIAVGMYHGGDYIRSIFEDLEADCGRCFNCSECLRKCRFSTDVGKLMIHVCAGRASEYVPSAIVVTNRESAIMSSDWSRSGMYISNLWSDKLRQWHATCTDLS
ncbi:uncharacterized protein PHALS_04195 [Plasmopara halstedii]|uniref:Uncharacterized protein n=1 Tax=Plasmopara halstedii TaxID=4781 RepID=A0A0P1A8E9_PLAHL|nr:uncharacterized protein PHALS_04195 [Plasmopara halstedii]CEG36946.1 hypothetical protein PHALS_04195 [Plasmopara halstedii]|eukprot:XP_024573315.1 hypothetical protein PHALS_04195 [Plasmopara halstedii]